MDGPNTRAAKADIAAGRVHGAKAQALWLTAALERDVAEGHRSTPVAARSRSTAPLDDDEIYAALYGSDGHGMARSSGSSSPATATAALEAAWPRITAEGTKPLELTDADTDALYAATFGQGDGHRSLVRAAAARAAAVHAPYDGEHSHVHADTNGGEHEHLHAHSNDADHSGQAHVAINVEQQRLHEMGD